MKRGGGLHPARPDWQPPTKRPRATPGGLISASVTCLSRREGVPPPGWGVGVYVCLCAHSACTPPLLAGVCSVGVCAWAWVSAAPHHSWLGCSGCVCVFVCALCLYPATFGWSVWSWCVCSGSGFGCARHPWLGCWGVCVFLCPPRLYFATPGWGVWCGCVFGHGFRLPPAAPGWVVGLCVCLCAHSACSPPLLLGCVVCVCVCLGSGLGCVPPLLAGVSGCVCVRVPGLLVPRHS